MGQALRQRQNKKLAQYINKLGYADQKAFAAFARVSPSTVSNWMYGREPLARDIARISKYTGTSIEELYDIFEIGA